jgi:PTH2 family peptidyl-tRNA hydrolase
MISMIKKFSVTNELKQVIVVRADLKLSKGKLAVQAAHAAIDAMLKMQKFNEEWVNLWLSQGMKKSILKIENEKKLLELFNSIKKELPAALIKDAGLTELKPNTITCFGVGPAPSILIDKFTKQLKLI